MVQNMVTKLMVPHAYPSITYTFIIQCFLFLQALDLIKIALNDPWVRTGLRLNLVQRAKRICNASKNKHLRHHLSEFEVEELKENIEV